jgi:hypothetical protein
VSMCAVSMCAVSMCAVSMCAVSMVPVKPTLKDEVEIKLCRDEEGALLALATHRNHTSQNVYLAINLFVARCGE